MPMTCVLNALLLAQADGELPEVTLGNVLTAVLMLIVFAASLTMLMVWFQRYRAHGNVLPVAARQPLAVPVALTAVGVVLTTIMALNVVASVLVPTPNVPVADQAAPAGAALAEDAVARDEIESAAVSDSAIEAEPAADVAGTDIDAAISQTEAPPEAAAQPNPELIAREKANLQNTLWQTLNMNGVMFVVFGSVLLFHSLLHPRQSVVIDGGKTIPDNNSNDWLAESDANSASDTQTWPQSQFVDSYGIDSRPESELNNQHSESSTANAGIPPVEPWSLSAELTFAVEAFLAAWLPTVILRILIVGLLPEAPSHPFLKMLTDGVDKNLMLLILLMAVVVAPLVEELLYRVVILGGLWQFRSSTTALVVSSILFAAAHGFPDSIALLPLSAVLGYVYLRRRSYRTVILVHFLFNGFNMTLAGLSML